MKLKELVKTFGLSASQVEDLDVYPEHAIRNIEFDRKTPRWDKGPDYRERTITRLIHHRASFNSEWNIFGDIAKMVLAFKCPVCKVDIGVKYTGGAGNTMCIEGTCKSCNVKVSMGIPSDCIRVHFEELPPLSKAVKEACEKKGIPVTMVSAPALTGRDIQGVPSVKKTTKTSVPKS